MFSHDTLERKKIEGEKNEFCFLILNQFYNP